MSLQHFKMIRELGKGCQGVVRLAQRLADGRAYALKEQNLRHVSAEARLKALQEVWLLGSLEHPGVVAQYDAFVQEGRVVQVLEAGQDGDLEQLLQDKGPLCEERVWDLAVQLLSALAYLSGLGVYQRDIKPKNIVVSGSKYMLVDFGIFCMEGDPQPARVGTPYFWAPELWYGTEHTAATEIYAAGCTLYFCCTGKRLFEAPTRAGLQDAILKGYYQPISERYSQDIRQLIQAMIHRDPGKRPTAQSLLSSPLLARHIDLVSIQPTRGAILYPYEATCVRMTKQLSEALDGNALVENQARSNLPPNSYASRAQEAANAAEDMTASRFVGDSPIANAAMKSGNPSPKATHQLTGRIKLRRLNFAKESPAVKPQSYKSVRKAVVIGNLNSLLSSVRS